eukprot:SAG31_NODE_1957_length_6817_cov_5.488389_9_plen_58_part_00
MRGRGQNGVIMVLKHPQYGGNPALPSVRFDLIMPVRLIGASNGVMAMLMVPVLALHR